MIEDMKEFAPSSRIQYEHEQSHLNGIMLYAKYIFGKHGSLLHKVSSDSNDGNGSDILTQERSGKAVNDNGNMKKNIRQKLKLLQHRWQSRDHTFKQRMIDSAPHEWICDPRRKEIFAVDDVPSRRKRPRGTMKTMRNVQHDNSLDSSRNSKAYIAPSRCFSHSTPDHAEKPAKYLTRSVRRIASQETHGNLEDGAASSSDTNGHISGSVETDASDDECAPVSEDSFDESIRDPTIQSYLCSDESCDDIISDEDDTIIDDENVSRIALRFQRKRKLGSLQKYLRQREKRLDSSVLATSMKHSEIRRVEEKSPRV
jgi:hypothetical protein